MQLALLGSGWFAIERDDVNQERGRRQAVSGIVEVPTLMCVGRNDVGNKLA
jgi:hypothetical protein